jgi:HK97 family phage major capsid protein
MRRQQTLDGGGGVGVGGAKMTEYAHEENSMVSLERDYVNLTKTALADAREHTDRRAADLARGLGAQATMLLELRDELKARGWHAKAGAICDAEGAALWPTHAPPAEAKQYATIQDPLYLKAFRGWLTRAGQHGTGAAYSLTPNDEQKALREGVDSAGGYLVPAELSAQILSVVRERSTVRRYAFTVPTSRDVLQLGQFDFAGDWQAEVDTAASETTIAPIKSVQVTVFKARVKSQVSNDLLADQPALEAWLTRAAGDQLALLEDKAMVAGSGIGRPLGFAVDPSVGTTDVEGTTTDTISNTSAAAGSATKLMTLDGTLPDAFSARARWFMTGSTHAKISALSGPGGTGWAFDSGLLNADGERTLLGHPVSRSAAMQDDGTNGNRVVALVDLSQYVIATRNLLSLRVLREPVGELDQTLFVLFDRIGGVLAVSAACRVGVV